MHHNKIKSLIKECIVEVLMESLTEAFDPLSQGPNPVDPSGDTNPYPAWNSKMRTLEEDEIVESDEHGRYAQDAGAGQFDQRTFGKL